MPGRASESSEDPRGQGELPGLPGVARAWAPLAASWLLMACELPALSAVVARLANPELELAAYGGVILPIALVIEAPIIMLLSASTALSRDRASYRELRRFTNLSGAILTLLHLAIALTPLYDLVVGGLIGAPAAVSEAARPGFLVLTPWTWAIAYRRFNQGALIRFGHSRAVTVGTMIRLGTNLAILTTGWVHGSVPGALLAATAVASGVTAEAIYSGLRVRPVVREHLSVDDPGHTPLRGRAFLGFYVPLALTPIISLVAQPLASAGVTRMPETLHSLAAMPVVLGLLFMFQSVGLALTEVVVAGLDRRGAAPALWRFSVMVALGTGALVVIMGVTPLAGLWFGTISGLTPELVELATVALLLGLPISIARALQSWYAGVLVHARRTRPISEAVAVFLGAAAVVIGVGVATQRWAGIHAAVGAFSVGQIAQTVWLWWRSRGEIAALGGGDPR
ncbi:hypothetical protein ENSA5_08220 [Enhygromyxa salina]|uniref:Uncharacterized protein n=1 Tax=Enhygromyxa salina TaxID=215803 RepID=A0A2S9YGX7_9BACT|nr:hypothetical protein [Enhygromyxa salina]PRQ04373.1 hypothetical protein ENSA5_08220 [Enhygromyxa salina]